jgi:thermitase
VVSITSTFASFSLLKRRAFAAGALFLGAAFTLLSAPLDAEAAQGERWARGRILVKPKAGMALQDFDRVLQRHLAKRSGKKVHGNGAHVIALPLGVSETTAADLLSRDAAVEFAEVDRLVEPDAITTNDPYFASAWHLPKIGATDAWSSSTGAGVTIAILDSGVDGTHPDLAPLMVAGWNFYDGNANTADVYGHGTKVAGAAAALSNNGVGVASVSWQSKIMPLRVSLPDGTAYLSTIASAITYAADHGARVANVSFQGAAGSPTVQNAAQYMKGKGGLVVISAGNTSGLQSFDASDSLIAVSATDSADGRASFSSYGAYVDVAAPGVSIYTTANGGGYASVSGTSFSAPITGGVIALMMSRNPALSPAQIESALKSTAVDLGTSGRDDYFGVGRINAAAAVAAAGGNTAPPPPPSNGGGGTATASLSISFPSAVSTLGAGTTITANWSGISAAVSTDWIGLHAPGAASTTFIDWMYVSCSKTPSAARASGSCAFALPGTLASGNYELRLHTANTYSVLARSSTFGVTAQAASGSTSLSVNATSVVRGSALTATWSGISAPTSTDWIGLHRPGEASTAFIDWMYVSCSKSPAAARVSGSCSFTIPSGIAAANYELRLHTANIFTVLAKTGLISAQ